MSFARPSIQDEHANRYLYPLPWSSSLGMGDGWLVLSDGSQWMAKLYKIRGWMEHYENNRTKEMKDMRWVPFPNKHDGDGYSQMVEGENGAAMLGAWVACVQVASKCEPRGTLLRSSRTPHTAASLARITRLSEKSIQNMLDRACGDSIQWLEVEEITGVISIELGPPQEGAGIPQEPARKGREWNGREEKKRNFFEPKESR